MKTQNPLRSTSQTGSALRSALTLLASLLVVTSAHASSQTWSNAPVDATWTNINNWIGRAVPGGLNITGNNVNNDVATFNSPIPLSGIGGSSNPIVNDNATTTGARARQLGGITFDTANCGAYWFSNNSAPVLPEFGVLYVSHNGSIQLSAAVTNRQTFMVPLHVRLPSSTAGIYNLVNNSTNPSATLYINTITNDSANTRGTDFRLGGSNTGTNTIGALSAGTTTSGGNGLTKLGDGTWILAGPNDLRAQTVVSITAGTLIVKDIAAFNGANPGNVTITNTGILQLDGVTLNQLSVNLNKGGNIRMNGNSGINGVVVGAHTGTSATLSTMNASDVFAVGSGLTVAAVVSGGAADTVLNTAGPGTLVFGQDNTYAGRWNFVAATNQVTHPNALGTGANANVAAGAILDLTSFGPGSFTPTTAGFGGSGSGTGVGISAATVMAAAGGTLDLSSKAVNLTFTPTSATGDTTHPALYIAQGTLALNGNTFFVNNASGAPLGAGTYRLIAQAAGAVTSSGGYGVLVGGAGLAASTVAEIQVAGGDVNLVVSLYFPKDLVWKGGNPNSDWDVNASANFLAGATPSVFHNSDNVLFNSAGSANPTVNLVGTLAPGSATVDSSANDYSFTGSGQLGGTTSLTKLGSGALLLQTANSYAGGTVVSNGVLRYGIANAISSTGAGDVAVYGSGTLDLNNFDGAINGLNGDGHVDNSGGSASVLTVGNNNRAGAFSGVIQNSSGTLALTKVGTNTQTLSASNSYSGPTTLNSGILVAANEHALGVAGDLTLNAGTLNVQSSRLYLNSLAGTGGTIANDSTPTTNRVIITGTGTTTFSGVMTDGAGGGGMALTLLGGSLFMAGGNTYTGGTIVGSGATFNINNGPAGVIGPLVASNNATLNLNGGSTTPGTPTSITTVDGATVNLTAGALGKIWGGQFIGSATATNRITTTMSFGGDSSFKNFLGVVRFEAAATERFINIPAGAFGGGDDTTFEWVAPASIVTRDPATVHLGHIVGGAAGGGIDGATGGGTDTYVLGGKGLDSTFFGYVHGPNNLVKSGAGRLTFAGWEATTNTDSATYTNYVYFSPLSYSGTTTISNGVLALVSPNNLSNSPTITLAAPTAVLDARQMGYVSNFTDANGDNSVLLTNGTLRIHSGQTLAGWGTILGTVIAESGSIVAPGFSTGTLIFSNSLTLNGEVNLELNRASNPNSDRIAAPAINVEGATINVTNIGADLVTGSVYQLFSVPVAGTPAAVNLPVQNQSGSITYVLTNKLAIDGSIQVLSGAAPVDTAPTNLTASVTGSQLTLSWPASHTGWELQTNSVDVGNANLWFTYPGSDATNQVVLTIDPSNPNVYYRIHLQYTP